MVQVFSNDLTNYVLYNLHSQSPSLAAQAEVIAHATTAENKATSAAIAPPGPEVKEEEIAINAASQGTSPVNARTPFKQILHRKNPAKGKHLFCENVLFILKIITPLHVVCAYIHASYVLYY